MSIWIYSPGNLKGTGLITTGASVNAQGVVDLNETTPGQWGYLGNNLLNLKKNYPESVGLGFRVAAKHFRSLIELKEFPNHKNIFFIIPDIPDNADIDFVNLYPQFDFYIEVHSVSRLKAIEHYRKTQALQLKGYVIVSSESGGRTGDKSAFMQLQELGDITSLPIFLRGGIGVHTAGVLPLTKIAGLVLDDQVLLLQGSPLSKQQQETIARLDGRESDIYTSEKCDHYRIVQQHSMARAQNWISGYKENDISNGDNNESRDVFTELKQAVYFGDTESTIWPVGQMISMADIYRKKYNSVQKLVAAIRESVNQNTELAFSTNILSKSSTLAKEHNTALPVVQGPMTRVSDTADFAFEVAKSGGLPFIALALLKGSALNKVLTQTHTTLKDKPWGVGILGFVPPELREEQIKEVLKVKPKFAIIAGGRPDHAEALEQQGIKTYLHVPVSSLLTNFIKQGSTRFIFEGRECGGHVGPLNSFPLWEQMVTILLDEIKDGEGDKYSVLFAGGISNALSSAMVAALSAQLSVKGIKVGILMGTSYLVCEEAVSTKAITASFQNKILDSDQTTLLISGPGHANRCVSSPFSDEFKQKRKELLKDGHSQEDITKRLDDLLLGRLRIASKGLMKNDNGEATSVSDHVIKHEGMFMAGEAANLIHKTHTLDELHADVIENANQLLGASVQPHKVKESTETPVDVAIVGISLFVPGSHDLETFWDTILNKKSQIKEIPSDRWDWRVLFDSDPHKEDKIYSKWGGFIDDVLFDPLKYGIPPKSIPNITTAQLLALENVTLALEDAGIDVKQMDRDNTSTIFAATDAGGFLANSLMVRSSIPFFSNESTTDTRSRSAGWTEETFPGILSNVVSGRVANRLDFGGRNYAVDAACASSLVAVDLGVRELTSKRSNIAIAGGIDVGQTPFGYLAFSKTGALSANGESMPFDKKANGIVMSEGSAVFIMKRLEDAKKDGDKIYAVIKGIAGSSDGKAMGLTAPRSEGQKLSVSRAYSEAGFGPDTIGYYEAHGTGTMVGDKEELDTIYDILKDSGTPSKSVTLGSVKSILGHTKMAAGMVSLAKTALALYYKVLPPQGNINNPLDKVLNNSPVFFHDKPMPWLVPANTPRRAGVSAFGFGGTNFHTVLEEYTGHDTLSANVGGEAWPQELLILGAATEDLLVVEIQKLAKQFEHPLQISLRDLSWNLVRKYTNRKVVCRVSFTVSAISEVSDMLKKAIEVVQNPQKRVPGSKISYNVLAVEEQPKIAFLFSGQGSQHINMAREMALYFSEFRENLELADSVFAPSFDKRFSEHIYPGNSFDKDIRKQEEHLLNNTHVAQPSIGVISTAYLDVLSRLGIKPNFLAGHSFGEITALHASGAFPRDAFFKFTEFRGRVMVPSGKEKGAMTAVIATADKVQQLIDDARLDIVIANYNGPSQVVVSGSVTEIQKSIDTFKEAGIKCFEIPVSDAFHSPLMADANKPLNEFIKTLEIQKLRIPVFSNVTGKQYPAKTENIRKQLCSHLQNPVQFISQVKKMYAAGAKIFVEIGPNSILTGLAGNILEQNDHTVLSVAGAEGSVGNLLSVLGKLWTEGVTIDLYELFSNRNVQNIDIDTIGLSHSVPNPKATSWLINGHGVKPVSKAFEHLLPQPLLNGEDQLKQTKVMNKNTIEDSEKNITTATQHNQYNVNTNQTYNTSETQNMDTTLAAYAAYQQTMQQFLKTQEHVMHMFLGGRADMSDAGMPKPEKTVQYSNVQMPTPPQPTIHQSSVASQEAPPIQHDAPIQETLPATVTDETNSGTVTPDSVDSIVQILVKIIADRTGYPEDMIDINLNLEADLGVDSIKRMEILGKFFSRLPKAKEIEISASADRLVRIKHFKTLVESLAEELAIGEQEKMPLKQG